MTEHARIQIEDVIDYRQTIEKHGFALVFPHGVSMQPLIREGKNYVLIKRLDSEPTIGEILAFEQTRDNEKVCIIHRLIATHTTPSGERIYITRGDNCACNDKAVHRKDIIGRATDIYDVDSKRHRTGREHTYLIGLWLRRPEHGKRWMRRLKKLITGYYFKK